MTTLQEISESVRTLAPHFAIESATLFGSFARGEADESSDVDVLIATSEGFSLFDAARFKRQLSEMLSREVDVVSKSAVKGTFANSITRDQVTVYERA